MSGDFRWSQVYIKSPIYQYAPPQPVDDETLVAAQERLATLPLDRIPDPAALPHTLRHTCGHNLVEAGVSIDRVAAILGHEKLDTTAVYTMPSDKELQREVEKIAGE